ncbi:hypothetical protein BK649_21330 [Pseudomonas canadensis]|uniref:Uncharacterized protein n=1 Tax=Pseudomonas canadensis TaxID=915099 RepID=A0A423F2B9_9PSED|nr:hypothetical protein BK649_21330 [Pseudomonas canadensis]
MVVLGGELRIERKVVERHFQAELRGGLLRRIVLEQFTHAFAAGQLVLVERLEVFIMRGLGNRALHCLGIINAKDRLQAGRRGVEAGQRGVLVGLEVLPAVLAEVLQASGLGTVLGVATFGEAVDAAIVYIVAGQARAGFVEALDMLQHLFGAIGRVSIMFKIAYTFA